LFPAHTNILAHSSFSNVVELGANGFILMSLTLLTVSVHAKTQISKEITAATSDSPLGEFVPSNHGLSMMTPSMLGVGVPLSNTLSNTYGARC
jgi:hypothetical protein